LQSAAVLHVVGNAFTQVPDEHVSFVNGLPSLQWAFVVQHPGVGA